MPDAPAVPPEDLLPRWAKVLDQSRCIGCHACSTACKSENDVPLGVHRTYVKSVEVGVFPQSRGARSRSRGATSATDAPCTVACPTRAMYRRPDGIVDFDKAICIGCKACIAACPYDAIFINPEDHSAEKCNLCAHRIDVGLEPACVIVCPTDAIIVGDLDDPASPVARIVQRDAVAVRRPEKETRPKVFYKGAHAATLDPLARAAVRTADSTLWSEQPRGPGEVPSGHPGARQQLGRGAARVRRRAPRAVGLAGQPLHVDQGHRGRRATSCALLRWSLAGRLTGRPAVAVGGAGRSAARSSPRPGSLLIADLEHPARFYLIFTRPQWRSWLVRGAFLIAGYGARARAAHLLGVAWPATGACRAGRWLAVLGAPLAAMTAIYTAFLFAQAKARDLWQSPLLPPHLVVQARAWSAAPRCCRSPRASAPCARALAPGAARRRRGRSTW